MNLAWRTVNAIAERVNLGWRTVNAIAHRIESRLQPTACRSLHLKARGG
jgi:hypothetical protein